MNYHAHITIETCQPLPKGWKATQIILDKDDRRQTDFMHTKHYCIGKNGIKDVDDIRRDVENIFELVKGVRYKIEQDSDFTRPITKKEYLECHIKVMDGSVCELKGFQRSRNPNERVEGHDIYFWNKRWYSGTLFEARHEVELGLAFVLKEILEIKFEHVLIDSRHELDSWWA